MTLTLGRCSGLRPGPGYPKIDGDRVSIQGYVLAANMDALRGARQQLLGLVDNEDEEVVPCIWASDPTFDGYYRPVSVDVEQLGVTRGRNSRFAATLQRLRDYAAPMFEVTVQSALRANAAGITAPAHIAMAGLRVTAQGALLLPAALVGATALSSPQPGPPFFDPAWTLDRRTLTTFLSAGTQYQFSAPPSLFYAGACIIERLYGSTWVQVSGRTIPATTQGQWRISNGLMRLTLGLADSTSPAVLEHFDSAGGGAWESVNVQCNNTGGAGSPGLGWVQSGATSRVEILRNSPEQVIVRHSSFDNQFTFSLQRGALHVVYTVKHPGGVAIPTTEGVKFASVTASTAITAGIRSTSADAGGNRWLLASPHAITTDLVNGSIRLTATQTVPATFAMGCEYNGASAISGNTAAEVVSQFMGAVSWRQRVVAP